MKISKSIIKRRALLKATALTSLTGATLSQASSLQTLAPDPNRRFLFVFGATGGASIVDSFLPIVDSESSSGINTYTSEQVQKPSGSNIRCTKPFNNKIQGAIPLGDGYDMGTFLSKHVNDMVVMTQEGSSINHQIASRRAVTGDSINRGRTIQEAVATAYGDGLLLPNCNMASAEYGGNGTDDSVANSKRAEVVADPRYFSFGTHGNKGLLNTPDAALVSKARDVRKLLEDSDPVKREFNKRYIVNKYLNNRDQLMPSLESAELINTLLLLQTSPDGQPVSNYNLQSSADAQALASRLPNIQNDPLEAQIALAFLLAKNNVSNAITIGLSNTPLFTQAQAMTSPLAFDWSHIEHRDAQNAMWGRMMNMVDNLIELLKATEFSNGSSFWDRSLIYIATEFGRDKVKQGGSGHNLNNGSVIISPALKGNRVYGGVDSNTALTYGFDPQTGNPLPGSRMKEGDVYSAICHAMEINFNGRKDFPGMMKST